MTAGIEIYRSGAKVVRVIVIGMKDMKGGVIVLKRVVSVLPFWPSGHGQ